MSLTDKIIKNTFYLFLSQAINFITPFILTPVIISFIGTSQFGVYAIVMGFIGMFGLFDLSVSTSFIKFISEHYNRGETVKLFEVINTGFFFYFILSFLFFLMGYSFSGPLLSLINIPPGMFDTSLTALRLSLIIFLLANSSTIFISILISLQKMYINSIIGIYINLFNVVLTLVLLYSGFGLVGVIGSNVIAVFLSVIVSIYLAKKFLPGFKFGIRFLKVDAFKKMFKFGIQMQISKMSVFLSEKYDEFLLGYFSVLSNVTFFNLASRVTRAGRFFPLQLFQQVAPVAAELNARDDYRKIKELFYEATKYLTFATVPVFIFIFAFSDLIMFTWMGPGYEVSSYLIKILAAGQLINLSFSAPGNSIIPNLGVPKYLMYEGLIALVFNLVLSFFLVKYLGITGAAIGSTVSVLISSLFLYKTSLKFFGENNMLFLIKNYLKPFLISLLNILFFYAVYFLVAEYVYSPAGRIQGGIILITAFLLYIASYIYLLFRTGYLHQRDKTNMKKLINHILPVKLKNT